MFNNKLANNKLARNTVALAAAALITLVSSQAFAAGPGMGAANEFDMKGWLALGAALAIGLGALGGTLAQGRAAAAALEGISRNPGAASRIQTPMILGLALIESLVLFSFVVAFLLQGKI